METDTAKTTSPVLLLGQSGLPMHQVMVRAIPNVMEPTLIGVGINFGSYFYYRTTPCMINLKRTILTSNSESIKAQKIC